MSRKSSVRVSKKEIVPFPETLRPFQRPKEGMTETLAQLDSNEWEVTMAGLQGVVRLTRHHMDVVDVNMHALCQALGKQIKNLRSQVARNACLAASELFCNSRKSLETVSLTLSLS